MSPAQAELRRKREDLLLARVHVLQQLQQSLNLRYQQMLKMALTDLDEKLARLT